MKKIYCLSVKPDRREAQSCAVSFYLFICMVFVLFCFFVLFPDFFLPVIQQLTKYLGKEQTPRPSSFLLMKQFALSPSQIKLRIFRKREHSFRTKEGGSFWQPVPILSSSPSTGAHKLRECQEQTELRGSSREQSFKVRENHGQEIEACSFQQTVICYLPPSSCFLKITLKMEMNFGLIFLLFSLQGNQREFKPTCRLTLSYRPRAK